MASTQTVLIDFQADFSTIQDAVTILEKTGKVDAELAATFKKTNTEIAKQGQELTKASNAANKETQSLTKLSDLMKQFPKSGLNRFLLQVGNELSAAGVKADQFMKKIDPKDTTPKVVSLRNELRQVREEMQRVALAGGVLSEEYKKLKARAGELDDTIKDVNSDIANAGSDTRGIDNVVGSISALAGGYSAVQGAAALFGEESEEVQKALLEVNAAMALATGLQQVSTALQKEGSLARLADATATGVQIAVQKVYTVVTGRATAATVAFKVALAATGIGAAIVLVIALANAFKKSNKDMDDATEAIERQNRARESMNKLLDQNLNLELARAETAGKTESELIRIRGRSLQQRRADLAFDNKLLVQQRDALDGTSAAFGKLNDQIALNAEEIRQYDNEILIAGENLKKSLIDEQKKALEEQKELTEKAIEAAKKLRLQRVQDAKAAAEIRVLNAKEGSEEQLEARKQLLGAELDLALNNEELTKNQRLLIADQYFKDYEQLIRDFNDVAAQAEVDQLERSLLNRNISNENRFLLEEAFIRKTAEMEIAAAEGNAEKVKLIAAKRDQDIADAHIASIRKTADQEAAITTAEGGPARRALQSVSANEKLKTEIRINAIRQLAEIETAAIDRQIRANRDAAAVQGSDQKALNIELAQLQDDKAAKAEETEKKITDLVESENKKRLDSDMAYIQATVAGLQALGDIIGGIQDAQRQGAENAIQRQQEEVDALLEAGAITEKEAKARLKRLELEERQVKQRAAQQQKNLAIFQAILAIPQAFIAGLTAPFPIGGPIYGAILAGIAAAQAGIIAARPVPRFATGKKGSYEGIGIAGEAGAELIQRADGSMEIAANRSLVYLGSRDKVYTAAETKQMMPYVNKAAMVSHGTSGIDYDKMAKAMKGGKANGTTVNIDKEFISESVAEGLSKVNYFGRYYTSKM